ncbi:lysophospholipid acyltransferase family protein [Chloroflexota bacterium]
MVDMDISYRILKIAAHAARLLPMPIGYFLAERAGDILYMVSGKRRRIVAGNLRRILGVELDDKALRRKVRGVCGNVAKNYFDLTKLSRLTVEGLDRSTIVEGWHYLSESIESHRGTIIATAHMGNFETVAVYLTLHGVNTAVFVEVFNSSPFLRNVGELRQTSGCRMLPVGMRAIRESIQILRHGGTMTMVCDRDLQFNGVKVKFFGEETTLPVGAVSLALRTGADIIPLRCVRISNSRSAISFEPPLKLVDAGDRSQSIRVNVERFGVVLERYIRQYPEQWTVMEPIWRNHAGG